MDDHDLGGDLSEDLGGFDDLRLRFVFIPYGATVPDEVLATFTEPVRIPAEFVPRRDAPAWADEPGEDRGGPRSEQVAAVPQAGFVGGDAFASVSVPDAPGFGDAGRPFDRVTGLPADPAKFYAPIGPRRRSSNPPARPGGTALGAYLANGRIQAGDPGGLLPYAVGQDAHASNKFISAGSGSPAAPASPAVVSVAGNSGIAKSDTPPIPIEPIAYYTRDVNNATAQALGIGRDRLGRAVHQLKDAAGLRGDDDISIHVPSGDVLFNGESIGNVYDEN